jgi:hypothetical protein
MALTLSSTDGRALPGPGKHLICIHICSITLHDIYRVDNHVLVDALLTLVNALSVVLTNWCAL